MIERVAVLRAKKDHNCDVGTVGCLKTIKRGMLYEEHRLRRGAKSIACLMVCRKCTHYPEFFTSDRPLSVEECKILMDKKAREVKRRRIPFVAFYRIVSREKIVEAVRGHKNWSRREGDGEYVEYVVLKTVPADGLGSEPAGMFGTVRIWDDRIMITARNRLRMRLLQESVEALPHTFFLKMETDVDRNRLRALVDSVPRIFSLFSDPVP